MAVLCLSREKTNKSCWSSSDNHMWMTSSRTKQNRRCEMCGGRNKHTLSDSAFLFTKSECSGKAAFTLRAKFWLLGTVGFIYFGPAVNGLCDCRWSLQRKSSTPVRTNSRWWPTCPSSPKPNWSPELHSNPNSTPRRPAHTDRVRAQTCNTK